MTGGAGDEELSINTIVNGKRVRSRVKVRQHLADFLREQLQLTGTHLGCEHGVCGACTVMVEGHVVRGCLMLAAQVDGKEVQTVEGLSKTGALRPLQDAFVARNAAQCAFCSAGMLLTAYELVRSGIPAGREEIRDHMSGNLCRCTGYQAIIDAIQSVIEAARPDARPSLPL